MGIKEHSKKLKVGLRETNGEFKGNQGKVKGNLRKIKGNE